MQANDIILNKLFVIPSNCTPSQTQHHRPNDVRQEPDYLVMPWVCSYRGCMGTVTLEPAHKFLLNAKIHHFTKQSYKLTNIMVIIHNSYTTLQYTWSPCVTLKLCFLCPCSLGVWPATDRAPWTSMRTWAWLVRAAMGWCWSVATERRGSLWPSKSSWKVKMTRWSGRSPSEKSACWRWVQFYYR